VTSLSELPLIEGELHEHEPFLQCRPSVQVGAAESGGVGIRVRCDPFPIFQFLFSDEIANKMIKEMSEMLSTPREMRYERHKH